MTRKNWIPSAAVSVFLLEVALTVLKGNTGKLAGKAKRKKRNKDKTNSESNRTLVWDTFNVALPNYTLFP